MADDRQNGSLRALNLNQDGRMVGRSALVSSKLRMVSLRLEWSLRKLSPMHY